ncbi:MAG: hypothetical protein WDM71_06115 [Ferruginibacter sp.]
MVYLTDKAEPPSGAAQLAVKPALPTPVGSATCGESGRVVKVRSLIMPEPLTFKALSVK